MTSDSKKRSIVPAVLVLGFATAAACGHAESSPPPAAPEVASAVPSASATPPASAAPEPSATASAAASAEPPAAETPPAEDEAAEGLIEHHRHHHRGGVTRFIAMSLQTLGTTPEQQTAIAKIQDSLKADLVPAREADEKLLKLLADGVAAGSIDKAKVEAAVGRVESASGAAHAASFDALDKLHAVLTPEQRTALVEKVRAHWEVWQEANPAEPAAGEAPKHPHLDALAKELELSPEQVDKIKASLSAAKWKRHLDPAKVEAHLKAFETAFASDTFEAKKLTGGKQANAHMTGWAAERMAKFLEAVAPVLTPDQRTKLADHLREHAEHKETEGESEP